MAAEPAELDLDEWVDGMLERLASAVSRLRLIDAEPTELGGAPGWRLLIHQAVEGTGAVTMERWSALAEGTAWTLSASLPTLAYDSAAAELARTAASFRLAAAE